MKIESHTSSLSRTHVNYRSQRKGRIALQTGLARRAHRQLRVEKACAVVEDGVGDKTESGLGGKGVLQGS